MDGRIEVHIQDLSQLFDSWDPSPFCDRDLQEEAEDYILESSSELPLPLVGIVIHMDKPPDWPAEAVEAAVNRHFLRKRDRTGRELSDLLRRGWISLAIGLAFLLSLLILGEAFTAQLPAGPIAAVLQESLLIGGWVAMWRPLEVLLYDWWPVAGRRRSYAKLARVPIHIVYSSTAKNVLSRMDSRKSGIDVANSSKSSPSRPIVPARSN